MVDVSEAIRNMIEGGQGIGTKQEGRNVDYPCPREVLEQNQLYERQCDYCVCIPKGVMHCFMALDCAQSHFRRSLFQDKVSQCG